VYIYKIETPLWSIAVIKSTVLVAIHQCPVNIGHWWMHAIALAHFDGWVTSASAKTLSFQDLSGFEDFPRSTCNNIVEQYAVSSVESKLVLLLSGLIF
jgi:hypothetical protein